ncbi:MAG: carbon starvation protein A [Acidaminococcaceae bacterium]|nr:carbon starvation protein A [Acidaminococcaceae bacterium]MDD4722062.1 carbon starvation protein A [Acidaminococcaceae bacterium]
MSGMVLLIGAVVVFFIAYITYGSWLAKEWGIDPKRVTPAHRMQDNIDYMPTNPAVLMGHHFSSIAGAGPIVGPITAAVFGWVPVMLWIMIGSIFFGGVHDFGSLVASIRHDGKSIGQIIEGTLGKRGKFLFSVFAYVTLLVVIAAFANIVAATFVASPQSATASLLFIVLAVVFGVSVYRVGVKLSIGTIGGVILLVVAIWLGNLFPLVLSKNTWVIILMVYIFVASIAPVWILLQPRDYLNSFLLYACIAFAFIGIIIYQPTLKLPAFTSFDPSGNGTNPIFPMLFVTVACGAISGFHSLVSSGTTSKQLNNEKDAKLIGYGSMLLEGVLAVVAVVAVGYIGGDKLTELLRHGGPVNVFSDGVGTFMTTFGFPFQIAKNFVALTISAFAMTTLDTSTRLGRFIFQELFSQENPQTGEVKNTILSNTYVATLITVVVAGYMSVGSYLTIWPVFGAANQLLAALSLLAISVWLKDAGKRYKMVLFPMIFMFAVTFVALFKIIMANFSGHIITAALGTILFILAIALVGEANKVFKIIK